MQLFCRGRCKQKTEGKGLSGAEGTGSVEAGARRTVLCDSRRLRVFLSAAGCKSPRLRITASHSDSPTLKLKPGKCLISCSFSRLNVEKYGGVVLQSWIDRPLSSGGRVFVREEDRIRCRLVYPDRDLLMIPSLAPHLSGGTRSFRCRTTCSRSFLRTEMSWFEEVFSPNAGSIRKPYLAWICFWFPA